MALRLVLTGPVEIDEDRVAGNLRIIVGRADDRNSPLGQIRIVFDADEKKPGCLLLDGDILLVGIQALALEAKPLVL